MHCSISCRSSPFDEDWETTMGGQIGQKWKELRAARKELEQRGRVAAQED